MRKTIYSIEDNMFRFWYHFVPTNTSIISRGVAELAYKRIEPHLSDYIGTVDKNKAFFGECKWTNEKVDLGVLERLIEKSALFHYTKKHYYLFTKKDTRKTV